MTTPSPAKTPDGRPVQLTLMGQQLQPLELITGAIALLLILIVPAVYQQRQSAKAMAAAVSRPLDQAAGEGTVVPASRRYREIRVHVVGAVNDPGVVDLTEGGRVEDAIRLAGGATENADLSMINLAEIATDGQQILVPRQGEVWPADGTPGVRSDAVRKRIRINACTKEELEAIPGIGESLAQAIIDYRTARGAFSSLTELEEIPGIGAKKRAIIAAWVTLD